MRVVLGLGLIALVAACGGEPEGGVTAEESRQLNEAAEMLESEDTLIASDETGLANGETAETGDVLVSGEE